jgi:penicillin-binding protein 2
MTDDAPRIRLRIIAVVAFSLFVALVSRAWFLQVMNAEAAEERAIQNTERVVRVPAPRGRILDASGRILVDNKVVTVVSIDKAELERTLPARRKADERREMLTNLAVQISRSGQLIKVADIENALRNSLYPRLGEVPIAFDAGEELIVMIGERPDRFPGVKISQSTVRDYRYGNLAAHLLGYVGRINDTEFRERSDSPKSYDRSDAIGKTGVERLFEDELRGVPGSRVFEVDRHERVIREVVERDTEPVPGNDVYLSIDIDLQKMVEDELRVALEQARLQPVRRQGDPPVTAPAGAAVVVDPRDGSVLAMASYPTFDPGEFVNGISQSRFAYLNDPVNHSPILNRAIQGEYAPGSTFKPITAYAALRGGFMGTGILPGPQQRVDDPGVFRLTPCEGEKCVWQNSLRADGTPTTHRGIDLRASLTVSSDTYYYAIGAEIARSRSNDHAIQDAALAFGLGQSTGVGLPSERSGRIPDRELKKELHERYPDVFPEGRWYIGDNINLSIGQGDTLVTPIQLANLYATLANGGTIHAPNIVRQIRDADGAVLRTFQARAVGQVELPPEILTPIVSGLVGVTSDQSGTAYQAFHNASLGAAFDLARWPIAAKTGTAEVKGKADTALFAAYGPSPVPGLASTSGNVPRYAMAIVLEQSGFGGRNAAPVVAKVFDALVNERVPYAYSLSEITGCMSLERSRQAAVALQPAPATTAVPARGATTTTTTQPPPATRPLVLPSGVACP